jgi:hypothetical protein
MVFVPEGQHDSSQARSAWIVMQRGPVPKGRSKSLAVPNGAIFLKIRGISCLDWSLDILESKNLRHDQKSLLC